MPASAKILAAVARATSYRDALESQSAAVAKPAPGLRSGLVALALFLGDIILWTSLFGACLWLLKFLATGSNLPNASVILIPLGVSILSSWLVGAYDRDTDFSSLRFASEFLIAGLFATVFGAGLTALFGSYGATQLTSRFLLLATPFAFTLLSLLLRRQLAGCAGWDQNGVRRVLLLGTAEEAASLQRALELAERPSVVERLEPSLATPEVVVDYLRRRALPLPAGPEEDSGNEPGSCAFDPSPGAKAIPLGAIVLGPSSDPLMAGLSPFLVSLHTTRLPVYTWSAFWRQRVRMHDVHDTSTAWLFERDFRLNTTTVYWHLKRLFDIVHSALALLLAAPVLLLAWIAIRIDSPGPAFFRQQRIGFRGKPFTIYKFRSMKLNSEADGTTTAPGDSRITRLGHFLRRSRIDEIPQLFNVLKGDMSFVGPRPEWTVCVDLYEQQLPYYHLRHLVKPGLTGWAQVNYPYGQDVNDARNKLSFDLYYVTHASLVLDSTIILKTLYVVLGRIGGR
jgi:lipopolysaccharide/colanic/teichoic acid biosynthesis glycosyltransferase